MGREVRTAVCTIVVCNTFEPPIIKRAPKIQRVNGYLREVVAYESRPAWARLFKMRKVWTHLLLREIVLHTIFRLQYIKICIYILFLNVLLVL